MGERQPFKLGIGKVVQEDLKKNRNYSCLRAKFFVSLVQSIYLYEIPSDIYFINLW
jgi:hypothetical protein